jgi:hypothetical protein
MVGGKYTRPAALLQDALPFSWSTAQKYSAAEPAPQSTCPGLSLQMIWLVEKPEVSSVLSFTLMSPIVYIPAV